MVDMWRIVLADDHREIRRGLRALLTDNGDMEVIGEAADGAEAIDIASRLRPDVLITDLKMPRYDGVEVTRRVRELSPETVIIIFSLYDSAIYRHAALVAGAARFLNKKTDNNTLVDIIREVTSSRDGLE